MQVFGFSFLGFENGANRFSVKFCIRCLTYFFENVDIVTRKAAKLENPVNLFLKSLLLSVAAKLENVELKMF